MSVMLVRKIQGRKDLRVCCSQVIGNLWLLCTSGKEKNSCVMVKRERTALEIQKLCIDALYIPGLRGYFLLGFPIKNIYFYLAHVGFSMINGVFHYQFLLAGRVRRSQESSNATV